MTSLTTLNDDVIQLIGIVPSNNVSRYNTPDAPIGLRVQWEDGHQDIIQWVDLSIKSRSILRRSIPNALGAQL